MVGQPYEHSRWPDWAGSARAGDRPAQHARAGLIPQAAGAPGGHGVHSNGARREAEGCCTLHGRRSCQPAALTWLLPAGQGRDRAGQHACQQQQQQRQAQPACHNIRGVDAGAGGAVCNQEGPGSQPIMAGGALCPRRGSAPCSSACRTTPCRVAWSGLRCSAQLQQAAHVPATPAPRRSSCLTLRWWTRATAWWWRRCGAAAA